MEQTAIHITPGVMPTPEEDERLTKLLELQNTIDEIKRGIEELQNDESLNKLIKAATKKATEIDKKKSELGITELEEEKNELISKLNKELIEFASSVDDAKWGPNQFTKGKKKEFSSTTGQVSILRSSRTMRTINVKKLLDTNPIKTQQLAEEGLLSLPIKNAEIKMSKEEIDDVAEKKTTHTYELHIKSNNAL